MHHVAGDVYQDGSAVTSAVLAKVEAGFSPWWCYVVMMLQHHTVRLLWLLQLLLQFMLWLPVTRDSSAMSKQSVACIIHQFKTKVS